MATTVLDSNNLDAIVKDATGEGLTSKEAAKSDEDKPAEKVVAEDGAEKKQEAKDSLDVEGEDGLTAREKADLSAKMLKAVGKRVREKREAEEFAAEQYNLRLAAERRAKELEDQIKAAPAQPAPQANAKPQRQNFVTDDEYITAITNHAVAEAMAKKAEADAKAAEETRRAEILATARTRIAKAIELVPDFEDVTTTADVEIPPHIAGYMQESEMFAELGYFLAKNQEVVGTLQKMSPARQLVEIGKIESKLVPFAPAAKAKDDGATPSKSGSNGKQPSQAAPRETGEAPSMARRTAPVITPISTIGSGPVEQNPETMNVRDHIAEFAKHKGVNLTRRQRH